MPQGLGCEADTCLALDGDGGVMNMTAPNTSKLLHRCVSADESWLGGRGKQLARYLHPPYRTRAILFLLLFSSAFDAYSKNSSEIVSAQTQLP